jgi:hypothetical protein
MIELLVASLIAIEPAPALPLGVYREESFLAVTRNYRECQIIARQEYVRRNLKSPWGQPIYRFYSESKSCFLVTYRKRTNVLDRNSQ